MQELKQSLYDEQAGINAEIDKHISTLDLVSEKVAKHIFSAGGKRLRPWLTLAIGKMLGQEPQMLYTLGAAIEMLHAATLLHDDILDAAEMRRGKKSAHVTYGLHSTVLSGDALLAKSLHMVSSFNNAALTACISEAVLRTAEGQLLEFSKLRDPEMTELDYINIISGKTAWMLRASCELGAIAAGAETKYVEAASRYGMNLGVAFQIVDDALDYSPCSKTGKPSGGDLREGKVTPPLLLYINSLPATKADEFKLRFKEHALSQTELTAVSEAIYKDGLADASRDSARLYISNALEALKLFSESDEKSMLTDLVDYILIREK